MSYTTEKATAVEAVREAARLCTSVRASMVDGHALEKEDRSPVTVADYGSQALICRLLSEAFPEDEIVGEEDAAALREPGNAAVAEAVLSYLSEQGADADLETACGWIDGGNGSVSGRFWTIDPIDGTKGFLRNDQYTVALALIVNGQVQVGALACPALQTADGDVGALFVAVRGEGAEEHPLVDASGTSGRSLRVNADPERLRFVESVESGHGNQDLQGRVARAVRITTPSLRMDSQAKYAAVARGDAALYLRLPTPGSTRYAEKIWDHAAGAILVEEAGGRVSDMHGRPLDWASDYRMRGNRGVVVSNGAIHDAVIEALGHMVEKPR